MEKWVWKHPSCLEIPGARAGAGEEQRSLLHMFPSSIIAVQCGLMDSILPRIFDQGLDFSICIYLNLYNE